MTKPENDVTDHVSLVAERAIAAVLRGSPFDSQIREAVHALQPFTPTARLKLVETMNRSEAARTAKL